MDESETHSGGTRFGSRHWDPVNPDALPGAQMAVPTPTPGELLRQIPNSARRPRSLAYARFAIAYLGYLLCVVGVVLAPGWVLKALFVLATASMIGGLYILG